MPELDPKYCHLRPPTMSNNQHALHSVCIHSTSSAIVSTSPLQIQVLNLTSTMHNSKNYKWLLLKEIIKNVHSYRYDNFFFNVGLKIIYVLNIFIDHSIFLEDPVEAWRPHDIFYRLLIVHFHLIRDLYCAALLRNHSGEIAVTRIRSLTN